MAVQPLGKADTAVPMGRPAGTAAGAVVTTAVVTTTGVVTAATRAVVLLAVLRATLRVVPATLIGVAGLPTTAWSSAREPAMKMPKIIRI
jgi:hypothetical protein